MVLFLMYLIQSCKSGLRMKRKCATSSTGSSGSSVRRGENSLPNYRMQRTRQGAPLMQTLDVQRTCSRVRWDAVVTSATKAERMEEGNAFCRDPRTVAGRRRVHLRSRLRPSTVKVEPIVDRMVGRHRGAGGSV